MTLIRSIAGLLPIPARHLALSLREQWRLRGARLEKCDSGPLHEHHGPGEA